MYKILKYLLIPTAVVIMAVGIGYISQNNKYSSSINQQSFKIEIADRSKFFKSLNNFEPSKSQTDYALGITPHHLLANDLIAELMYKILSSKTKTIIIVGPNHFEAGLGKAITSNYVWETPLGEIEPNNEIINELFSNKLISIENNVVSNDHSIRDIIPYCKYFAPNAKIVPIVLKHNYTIQEIDAMTKFLQKYAKEENTIVIGSIDFSHYLDGKKAQKKDEETLTLMKRHDILEISKLKNDHLDCSACLSIILSLNNNIFKSQIEIVQNTNSGLITNNSNQQTTSYFTLTFRRRDPKD
jgi:AmmeMemoRadiSam system protein B